MTREVGGGRVCILVKEFISARGGHVQHVCGWDRHAAAAQLAPGPRLEHQIGQRAGVPASGIQKSKTKIGHGYSDNYDDMTTTTTRRLDDAR